MYMYKLPLYGNVQPFLNLTMTVNNEQYNI